MSKIVISILGLPASGKGFYGKILADENHLKFYPEVAAQLISEGKFKAGLDIPFEFDNAVYKRNTIVVPEIMNLLDKIVLFEGSPFQDIFYLEGRHQLSTVHKDQRKKLLDVYNRTIFLNLLKNSRFIFLHIPPQISLNRQEPRVDSKFNTLDLDLLEFVHKKLLNFYKENRNKSVYLDLMGKTQDEVLKELRQNFPKLLVEKE